MTSQRTPHATLPAKSARIAQSVARIGVDWVRELCLSFPHATEQVTWGDDLTFRVGGKIFAVAVLVPASVWLTFKASPDNFADLTERPGVIPAPYLARAKWVALETKEALSQAELSPLLYQSYQLVLAKLPKKACEALAPAKSHSPKTSPSKLRARPARRKR
jgi:predicted DNA-binding protein (MmcQ/YjbR family)